MNIRIYIFAIFIINTQLNYLFSGENYWTYIGPEKRTYRAFAIDPQNPNNLYAGNFWKSKDSGVSWEYLGDQLFSEFIMIHPNDSLLIYAGAPILKQIKRSTDGGQTFTALNMDSWLPTGENPGQNPGRIAFHPDSTNILYIAGKYKIYKSSDMGDSWKALGSDGLPTLAKVGIIVINPKNVNIMYASSVGGTPAEPNGWYEYGVYKTEDGGNSWRQIWGDDNHNNIFYLNIDPITPDTLYIAGIPGTWRTMNGGESWSEINSGVETPNDNEMLLIHPVYHNILYCNQNGSYYSYDFGDNWISLPKDSLDYQVSVSLGLYAIDPIENKLYAGGPSLRGIWTLTLPIQNTNVKTVTNHLPKECILFQSYPNPFNPTTTIRYSIFQKTNVKIIVYNSIGEKTSILVDSIKETGNYEITWEASMLPSGLYFIQIVTNNFKQVQKCLLLK